MADLQDRLCSEFQKTLRATEDGPLVEPTLDEIKNGWTAESLTKYLAEQKASQSVRADWQSLARRVRPTKANSRYNPHKWRG